MYRQGQSADASSSNSGGAVNVGAVPDTASSGSPQAAVSGANKLLELELTFLVPWRIAGSAPTMTSPKESPVSKDDSAAAPATAP